MRNQEILEKVANHLFTQGKQSLLSAAQIEAIRSNGTDAQSYSSLNVCAYLAEDGCKCAIGFFIPKDEYNISLECTSIDYLKGVVEAIGKLDDKNHFLENMQVIHDEDGNWVDSVSMQKAFKKVAKRFALNADFVDHLSFADGR
jgi:hypothetical protein